MLKNKKIHLGNALFKFRSITPIPFIAIILWSCRPANLGKLNYWLAIIGLLIAVGGELIRVLSVGYSFSGTSGREAYLRAEALNTSGIYSLVRNPLYIGNYLIFSGLIIAFSSLTGWLILSLFLGIQYHFIILSEEHYLQNQFQHQYIGYSNRVNRLIPRFKYYQPPAQRFSWKKVFFKENDSIFNLGVMYLLILAIKEYYLFGRVIHFKLFIILILILSVGYLLVKIIKKTIIYSRNL